MSIASVRIAGRAGSPSQTGEAKLKLSIASIRGADAMAMFH